MSEATGPALARDRLRARLRDLRESRSRQVGAVEREMNWPASALTNIESGTATISPRDVASLLATYGGLGDHDVAALQVLAHAARTPRWWSRYGFTDEHQQFVGYEAEASRINVHQPLVVPGLLQTVPYATAATAAILGKPLDDVGVLARVQVRAERQRLVEDRIAAGAPPHLTAILDEAVLLRPVGGEGVLRDQLEHLLTQAVRPHVTLVVMPLRSFGHVGLGGVFELLEFDDEGDQDVVFIESVADDYVSHDRKIVAACRRNVEDLISSGSTGDDALAFVRQARDTLAC